MASMLDKLKAANTALVKKAQSGQKVTSADFKASLKGAIGSKGFLDKAAKTAGRVVVAPVKVTATVAAAPFKITGKITGVKALTKAGNVVSSVTTNPLKPVAKVTAKIGTVARKVPVVGKPLSAVVNLGNAPVKLVAQVSSGENINQAVVNNIKEQVRAVKEIAPYAKMVVSLVPGVGTAVSAAICAGSALATGQSITDAMVAGIKGAVPGGVIAQTAFSISVDVLSGKSLNTAAVNALPLPANQKSALNTVVSLGKDLAAGKNVVKSVIAAAQKQLPADIQKALNIGIAVGFARSHQKPVTQTPTRITIQGKPAPANIVNQFAAPKTANGKPSPAQQTKVEGKTIADKDPVLKAGATTLKISADLQGYYSAIGMMGHTATQAEISKFESTVPTAEKNGFNIGMAAVIGLKQITRTGDNLKDFATAVAKGLNKASLPLKTAAVKTVAQTPVAKAAIIAVAAQNKEGWLRRLLKKLGFFKEVKVAA